MSKSFDAVLRSAFIAGARSMIDDGEEESPWSKDDQNFAEDEFLKWRQEFGDVEPSEESGAEVAVVLQSESDEERAETLSRTEAAFYDDKRGFRFCFCTPGDYSPVCPIHRTQAIAALKVKGDS